MIHNQSVIDGYFDFSSVYDELAGNIHSGEKFAEVGVFRGASLIHFASRVKKLGKNVECYAIDIWKHNAEFNFFMANCIEYGVNDIVKPIRAPSDITHYMIPDQSLFSCMLDGCHKYQSVVKDICNYLPKVTNCLLGHDHQLKTVESACKDVFGKNGYEVSGNCWIYRK